MAIPKRHEEHFLTCALCGSTEVCSSERELELRLREHMRRVHGRRPAYDPAAYKSVTILFEGIDPDKPDQPTHRTDPLYQMSKFASWFFGRTIAQQTEPTDEN